MSESAIKKPRALRVMPNGGILRDQDQAAISRPGRVKDAVKLAYSELLLRDLPSIEADLRSPLPKIRQAARDTLARHGIGVSQDINLMGSAELVQALARVLVAFDGRTLDADVAAEVVAAVGRELALKGA